MKNGFGQFNQDAEEAFKEAALEKYDFSTCQRPDGSYYGTGGTCRKGSPVSGVPKKEQKGKAAGGGGKMSADEKRDLQIKASKGDKDAMKKLTDAWLAL